MRLHTNHHTPDTIRAALARTGAPVHLRTELSDVYGSRSHARAYEIRLGADDGAPRRCDDDHVRRHNADGAPGKGATFYEWGRFLAELYSDEPGMRAGLYRSAADFADKTAHAFFPVPARKRECRDTAAGVCEGDACAACGAGVGDSCRRAAPLPCVHPSLIA